MSLDLPGSLVAMMRIRAFETALAKRPDHGFQLLSSGEEAVAVGLAHALTDKDQLLTGGRSIGAALARGIPPGRVMAELLGKATGPNGGRGGRGHIADTSAGFFGAHAVVGGNISVAAGVALALQHQGEGGIAAILFGDGACGSGALHETLNIAALWKLPLLFVCNNNQLSVSTARIDALAPARLSDLGATFGAPACTVDGQDILAVAAALERAVAHVRSGAGPAFVECISVRLRSHSTTARESRTRAEVAVLADLCPIRRLAARLELSPQEIAALEQDAVEATVAAMAFADSSPFPAASAVLEHVG